jgi:hypothetical protein
VPEVRRETRWCGGGDVASGDVVSVWFSSHHFQPKQGCPLSHFRRQKLVDRAVPCLSYLIQVMLAIVVSCNVVP